MVSSAAILPPDVLAVLDLPWPFEREYMQLALVAGLVHFAAELGSQLIGEGIETATERRTLLRLGVPFGQGYRSMSDPTKGLMRLVLDRRIRHGGHAVLRWNASNLVVTQDPAANLKPDKSKASEKVDGVVALIMALGVEMGEQVEAPQVYVIGA